MEGDEMEQGFTRGEDASLSPERPSGSTYWLIVGYESGWMEIFVTELGGEHSIPVFSFEEEARMFLEREAGAGWQVRETGGGELVSLLYGPCRSIEYVTLDPLPRMVAGEISALTSMDRECFVESIVNRRTNSSTPAAGLKQPVRKSNGHPQDRPRTKEFRRNVATFRRYPESSG